jgi:hypothetical protein
MEATAQTVKPSPVVDIDLAIEKAVFAKMGGKPNNIYRIQKRRIGEDGRNWRVTVFCSVECETSLGTKPSITASYFVKVDDDGEVTIPERQ